MSEAIGMDEQGMGVPTGEEWEQAQYLPGDAVASAVGPGTPKKKVAPPPTPLHRVPTGEEWEKAQRLNADQIKGLRLPLLPTIPKPAAEETANPLSPKSKGKALAPFNLADPTTYANPVLRQIVNPALDNPIQTAITAPLIAGSFVGPAATPAAALAEAGGRRLATAVGAVMGGQMAHMMAVYGFQKAAEMQLSPEDRARAEADPERVSGEAAAVQAAMLGMGYMLHVGVKAMQGPSYGAGMLEAGASGVHETMADPAVAAERTAPFQGELNAAHAAYLEQGAASARGIRGESVPTTPPAGLEATASGATLTRQPKPVEGLEAPETVTPGKVTPVGTEPASAPLDERAALDQSVRDYTAKTAAEDEAVLSKARQKAADDIAKADRFRPRRRGATVPFAQSEQGAQIIGAAAARHGMPETANPYHPDSPLATEWDQGHAAGVEASASATTAVQAPEPDEIMPWTPGRSISVAKGDPALMRAAEFDRLQSVGAKAYPEGFSMGGALTDNRIPGAEELPKRARGVDAPPATEEQALASALKPPTIPEEPARGLTSVEGTGETKTRGLSAGVQEKAVANTLTNTLGDLPEYRTVNMADQATRASDLLASDYALARRVALGEVDAPAGLLPEAVFTAVENRAIAEGDVATIRDLATGGLTTEATTMGQRIRALAERDPDSPVSAISRVVDARSGGVENVDAQTAKLAAQIKKHLDKITLPEDALVKLLDSLRC